MSRYQITGLQKADITDNRSKIAIEFRTAAGPLTLDLNAAHLEHLITMLEGLEMNLSLMNPAAGAIGGEPAQMRVRIVEHYQSGHGVVADVPMVLVGLKTADKVFRWFGLDGVKAAGLKQAIEGEIPKLTKTSGRH